MGISSEPPLVPPLHQIVLLIAYLSREGSDAPAQSGSLTRTFAVHRHNVYEGLLTSNFRHRRHLLVAHVCLTCADPESFAIFFSLLRGGRIQIPLSVGHNRHTSETPFGQTLNTGFVIFEGTRTIISKKKTYIFYCDFPGRVRTPCLPLDPRIS